MNCNQYDDALLRQVCDIVRDYPSPYRIKTDTLVEMLNVSRRTLRGVRAVLQYQHQPIAADEGGFYWCASAPDVDHAIDYIGAKRSALQRVERDLRAIRKKLSPQSPQQQLFTEER